MLLNTFFYYATAQESPGRNILLAGCGVSIPYGEFSWKTFNSGGEFATVGPGLDVEIMHFTRSFFGFSARVGYSSIFFGEKAYRSEYERILGTDGEVTVSAGNYQFLSGMAGFLARMPEFLDTRIILQVQTGYVLCVHPDLVVDHAYWGRLNTVKQVSDGQLMSSAGIIVTHALSEKYGISLSYTVNAAKPGFSDPMPDGSYYYFYIPVRYQNIQAGMTITF